jgi:hypothetical protein
MNPSVSWTSKTCHLVPSQRPVLSTPNRGVGGLVINLPRCADLKHRVVRVRYIQRKVGSVGDCTRPRHTISLWQSRGVQDQSESVSARLWLCGWRWRIYKSRWISNVPNLRHIVWLTLFGQNVKGSPCSLGPACSRRYRTQEYLHLQCSSNLFRILRRTSKGVEWDLMGGIGVRVEEEITDLQGEDRPQGWGTSQKKLKFFPPFHTHRHSVNVPFYYDITSRSDLLSA